MDFKLVMFDNAWDMIDFMDNHWKRVYNAGFHNDFDGTYWYVQLLKKQEKKPTIGDILPK